MVLLGILLTNIIDALPVQWREWAEGMIKAVGENPTYQIQMQAHFLWFLLLSGLVGLLIHARNEYW
ncbi:uncharacterized protein N7506_009471 [Penicillium brevicompactum]|uniref:uncharacterized protein n=1 Tax=Penicillium brevicompactum TaxID=5074 RepID=UPI002542297F|nr:uncharacterized protein N7506_009471 [Penicillium brevicompactum]KAJ5326369.1 hypothetical protein N7506_009471 [Penicillium brevicompactum]